jgi:sec-independent protein translocase protein TatB
MFNIGGGELLVIVLIALIVLGPQRLPDAMRTVGRVVGEVRRISSGFQQELRDAFEDSDVADQASPTRRREAVPLAAAVAEANPDIDDDAGEGDGADDERPASPEDASEPEPGDGPGADTSVAPVIADALDAIVGPSDQPTSDRASAAESGPELGDERAAS